MCKRVASIVGCCCLLAACANSATRLAPYEPVDDCVSVPSPARAQVDRERNPDRVVAGCRSFGADGCSACCKPTLRFDGAADCLQLNADGERLLGGSCPESCEPCAACTSQMEDALRDFPEQTECSCTTQRETLGCELSKPCECYCMDLEIAAHWCSHLVCNN
jgi:hypothetical protein